MKHIYQVFQKGFFTGTGIALGFLTTTLVAVTTVTLWSSGESLSSTKLNQMVVAIQELQSAGGVSGSIPGVIVAYGGASAPTG